MVGVRGDGGDGVPSRLRSPCMKRSREQASANSGASIASSGRTLSTSRISDVRLFSWRYLAR